MARKACASPKEKAINLALQGGGAHGAFTWGVLNRLLEDESLEIEAITGTSAGAMNGALLVCGMQTGGRAGAQQLLHDFWHKISTVSSLFPLQPTMLEKMTGTRDMSYSPGFMALDFFTRLFSPYQYNPLNLNPLRNIVEELIDFEVIRKNKDMQLFVNATNVRTGKIKVFETKQMTLDVVMASACLPFIFKTVFVDGEPYWDGGYSGNPALFPLFYRCNSNDIMVVQINPIHIDEVPTDAAAILDRVNEISFNSTLMREMRAIAFVGKLLTEHRVDDSRYRDIHIHLVEAEALMNDMGTASKMNADWEFLTYLRDIGYQAATDWLHEHRDKIGHESSIDIADIYM